MKNLPCKKINHSKYLKILFLIRLCLLLGIASSELEAQNEISCVQNSVGLEYGFGAIFKHSQQIEHLSNANPNTLELHYRRLMNDRLWSKKLKNPSLGLMFSYTNMDQSEILGDILILGTYMGIPILRDDNDLLEFRIGTGLTYGTNKFNLDNNRRNNLYSTDFSGLGYLRLSLIKEISNDLDFSAGMGLVHFSNGSFRLPNLGANILSINSGLYYKFGEQTTIDKKVKLQKPNNDTVKYHLNIVYGYGSKESFPVNSGRNDIYTLMFMMERKTQSLSSWMLGLDINKNTGLEQELNYLFPEKEYKNDYRVAAISAYSLNLGKFSALGHIGVYLYSPVQAPRFYYTKIGFRYEIINNLSLGLHLKAHAGVADFVEYVLVYKI